MSVGEKKLMFVLFKGFCFIYSLNLNFGGGYIIGQLFAYISEVITETVCYLKFSRDKYYQGIF